MRASQRGLRHRGTTTGARGSVAADDGDSRRRGGRLMPAVAVALLLGAMAALLLLVKRGEAEDETLQSLLRGRLSRVVPRGSGGSVGAGGGGAAAVGDEEAAMQAARREEAAAAGVEPFPSGPAPWGFGSDPSYGACLDKACSMLREARMAELKLPHLKPCRGSPVTAHGDAGEPGGQCPYDDGRCLYVLNTQPKEVMANWVEARFRDLGLFHYTTDLCSADIVLSNTRENMTEAVVEQFMRKDQVIINFQRWNTRDGGINTRTALSAAISALPSHTMLDAVNNDRWHTAFGTTLDFDPGDISVMPETYNLDKAADRARLLADTAEAANVMSLSDNAVCNNGVAVQAGSRKTRMPLVFNNLASDDGRGNIIVWSQQLLRDVRCDVLLLDRFEKALDPNGRGDVRLPDMKDLRVLWTWHGTWVVQPLIETLLMPVTLSTGDQEWRLFSIRSFALVASSASPTVLAHDGYLRVSEIDGRLRDISKPETMVPRSIGKEGADRPEEVGSLEFQQLGQVLRRYFPTHPDPLAALKCFMDRAVALAFAATRTAGSFETNGFQDRHWWFTFEFVIDIRGRVYMVEANRRPTFDSRVPHSKSSSIEWLADFSHAVVASSDLHAAGARSHWPLEGVRHSRPVLIDDSTEAPALAQCEAEGATVPFGEPVTDHIPEAVGQQVDLEPFPRAPAPWGYGNDPSYGACLNAGCTVISEERLEALHLPRSLRPCRGSAVTLPGQGEPGYGCPFADGKCLFVVEASYTPGEWAVAKLVETGLFHVVDDLCSADIVFSKAMQNTTEAIVEQFMRKDQIIINWQRWNTEAGGINGVSTLRAALERLERDARRSAERPGMWEAGGGVLLDFEPPQRLMPETYDLNSQVDRSRLLADTAAAAGVAKLSDEAVCREGAMGDNPKEKVAMPLQFTNAETNERILVWSSGMLRDVRCDVLMMNRVFAGEPGAENANLRLLTPEMGSLVEWRAEAYVETLMVSIDIPSADKEWRLFAIRAFAVVASSASPTVLVNDGYLRVSNGDDRYRRISKPATMPPNLELKDRRRRSAGSEVVTTAGFAMLDAALREYFPQHPNPLSALRCQMDRAIAAAFAGTSDDGTFETNGFRDRHWWFAVDFMLDTHGRLFLLEIKRSPAFDNAHRHSKMTSAMWFRDLANAIVGMEDKRRQQQPGKSWPLQGVQRSRPVLVDGSTEYPAMQTCQLTGATYPFGEAETGHIKRTR